MVESKPYKKISKNYLLNTLPDFKNNYTLTRESVLKNGLTKRHDMPVIGDDEVEVFASKLQEMTNEKIVISKGKIAANKLKPCQSQIYLDKALPSIFNYGLSKTIEFLKTSEILAANNNIIDGHHRWLSSMNIDLNMEIPMVNISLDKEKLIALARDYSDKIGNIRNA
jgi:hypothetical protein